MAKQHTERLGQRRVGGGSGWTTGGETVEGGGGGEAEGEMVTNV